jgi:hypothetical protein
VRHVHERRRLRVAERRALHADHPLEERREAVPDPVREHDEDDEPRPSQEGGKKEREHEPDRPPRSDPREPDKELVERVPAMMDDPALEMAIEGDQGSSRLVRSSSSSRSKGLPTKPCAPRAAACASSSSLLLNITTGMAPAP